MAGVARLELMNCLGAAWFSQHRRGEGNKSELDVARAMPRAGWLAGWLAAGLLASGYCVAVGLPLTPSVTLTAAAS